MDAELSSSKTPINGEQGKTPKQCFTITQKAQLAGIIFKLPI